MATGKQAKAPAEFRLFVQEIETAKLCAEATKVIEWHNAGKHDYRAHRDFLAVRNPERWGRRDHLTVQGDVTTTSDRLDLKKLTAEEWELYKTLRQKMRVAQPESA